MGIHIHAFLQELYGDVPEVITDIYTNIYTYIYMYIYIYIHIYVECWSTRVNLCRYMHICTYI